MTILEKIKDIILTPDITEFEPPFVEDYPNYNLDREDAVNYTIPTLEKICHSYQIDGECLRRCYLL